MAGVVEFLCVRISRITQIRLEESKRFDPSSMRSVCSEGRVTRSELIAIFF